MADEDKIQKQMEFIIEQQAHFASDIGQLKDIVARLANTSLQRIENLENKVSALADAQIKTEGNVSTLAEKMVELTKAQAHTDQKMIELTEAQAHTDQRLNVLIDIISEGRNGK